jgi:hypothetical protein
MHAPFGERDERVAHEADALPHGQERGDFVVSEKKDVHVVRGARLKSAHRV